MSVLCLICKKKLLSHSPGGLGGSLNHISDNVIVATACGHLYHLECLQSWFRTQRIKKQNSPESENNVCPSCMSYVKEEENRRIYLFEDHVDALERARMLERLENFEIYCNQLEMQIYHLQRENDIMVNKILTPPTSPSEDYDTIVKNDRVRWMRKDDSPLSGVVLSIFKKEGKLCAKIRLDRKIRITQRSNRLLSSFRLDKKQDVTVPFDEIVIEKDANQNNTSNDLNGSQQLPIHMSAYGKSLSSMNIFPSSPSPGNNVSYFKTSTMSLPDDSRRLFGIQESQESPSESSIEISQTPQSNPKPVLGRSVSYSPGIPSHVNAPSSGNGNSDVETPSFSSSLASLDQQRDYVVITPPWMKNRQAKPTEFEMCNSTPDCKNKHVTFADDHSVTQYEGSSAGSSVLTKTPESGSINFDQPYVNFPSPTSSNGNITMFNSQVNSQRKQTINLGSDEEAAGSSTTPNTPTSPGEIPTFQLSLYQTMKQTLLPLSNIEFDELVQELDDFNTLENYSNGCFDVTLLSLFHCPIGFDKQMLIDNFEDNDFCKSVKHIIREKFVFPLRQFNAVQSDSTTMLKESLTHLCSGPLDVEELLTILFEFTYKMSPFINYSLEMTPSSCLVDYLHQFFIDFTDKVKVQSVKELLERSLKLQDNLTLDTVPDPVLILQVPHSEDGVIHYDAVIPNLTMVIDHLLRQDSKMQVRPCYCDNEATIECKTCSKKHGMDAVLFCEKCKDLLEGIHINHDHALEISPIAAFRNPSTTLVLSSIICLQNDQYSVFLKDGREIYSPWLYVHAIVDGRLKMKQLPGFGYWLESLLDADKKLNIKETPPLLQKALKYSRVFFYTPVRSSEV